MFDTRLHSLYEELRMQKERLEGRLIISENLRGQSVEHNSDDFIQAGQIWLHGQFPQK